jgi:hypothetical protein
MKLGNGLGAKSGRKRAESMGGLGRHRLVFRACPSPDFTLREHSTHRPRQKKKYILLTLPPPPHRVEDFGR